MHDVLRVRVVERQRDIVNDVENLADRQPRLLRGIGGQVLAL